MATLLVLGSKPEPALPPRDAYDDVACANASGRSAAQQGLPVPSYTVISSYIASGKNPSNDLALDALRGLRTDRLLVVPRRPLRGRPLKQARHAPAVLRTTRWAVRRALSARAYRHGSMEFRPSSYWYSLAEDLCGGDELVMGHLERKLPSVGVLAVGLGLRDARYDRVVMAGFSFEITHAYAENPDIATRGSAQSRHAETDIALLRSIVKRDGRLFTTEPVVAERAGVPMLPGVRAPGPGREIAGPRAVGR